jgi:hypothetical protein
MDDSQLRVWTETGTVQSLTFGCKKLMLVSFNLELFNMNYGIKRGQNKYICFG